MSMKISNDTIGNRTRRDLPTFSETPSKNCATAYPPGGDRIAIIPDVAKYTPSNTASHRRSFDFGSDLFNRSYFDLFYSCFMSLLVNFLHLIGQE
jgi:hypothetical protein